MPQRITYFLRIVIFKRKTANYDFQEKKTANANGQRKNEKGQLFWERQQIPIAKFYLVKNVQQNEIILDGITLT